MWRHIRIAVEVSLYGTCTKAFLQLPTTLFNLGVFCFFFYLDCRVHTVHIVLCRLLTLSSKRSHATVKTACDQHLKTTMCVLLKNKYSTSLYKLFLKTLGKGNGRKWLRVQRVGVKETQYVMKAHFKLNLM